LGDAEVAPTAEKGRPACERCRTFRAAAPARPAQPSSGGPPPNAAPPIPEQLTLPALRDRRSGAAGERLRVAPSSIPRAPDDETQERELENLVAERFAQQGG